MNSVKNESLLSLPPEILLRILHFASVPSITTLYRVSRGLKSFIETQEQAIFSAVTTHNADQVKSFSRYYEGAVRWKELCKRETQLRKNWESETPLTTESVIHVGDPAWRFRPDFKRRFIVSTSQRGGVKVTCMDTGTLLWRLREVRPFAHLEYDEVDGRGTAVWDRWGNSVEVWRTTDERGVFEQVAVLHHDCGTRGYQLSYNTLCVVSTQGQAFVYDMAAKPEPKLVTHLDKIEDDAVGHLDQDRDHVMFSLGSKGYHVHEKSTGRFVGAIEPWKCLPEKERFIPHPRPQTYLTQPFIIDPNEHRRHGRPIFPPSSPARDRLRPLSFREPGLGPEETDGIDDRLRIDEDWGAGMISGSLMAGVSRAGKVVVVPNWKDCLTHLNPETSPERAQETFRNTAYTFRFTPHDDPRTFDLGGWLSIRDNRILFEVREYIYIVSLDADGSLSSLSRPSFATLKSSPLQRTSPVPISFMALYDDCLMHTYTTLGRYDVDDEDDDDDNPPVLPTKTIRVLSFAQTS